MRADNKSRLHGKLVLGTAIISTIMGYGRRIYANCTAPVGTLDFICTGNLTTTQTLSNSTIVETLSITTQAPFSIVTNSGDAFNLYNYVSQGGISFIDNQMSTITGYNNGIYAYLKNSSYNSNNSMTITTTGTVTGLNGVGIYAKYRQNFQSNEANTTITTNKVYGATDGIRAYHRSLLGTLSITTNGVIKGETGTGIYARSYGNYLNIVTNDAVSGGNGGISAIANASGNYMSALSIIANGDVTSTNGTGIYAYSSQGVKNLFIHANNITAKQDGIKAHGSGENGQLSITTTGVVTSTNANGIYAYNSSDNLDLTSITVQSDSIVSGYTSAISINVGTGLNSTVTQITNNGILKNLSEKTNATAIVAVGSYNNNLMITNNNQITGTIQINNTASNTFNNNAIWDTAGGINYFGNSNTNILTNNANATINAANSSATAPETTVLYGLNTFNNSGTINLQNAHVGNQLVITGSFVGTGNSNIVMNTTLNGDDSPSDKLVLSGGNASGTTTLFINNVGDTTAPTTGNGILVVNATNGATSTADSFVLGKRVASGVYNYKLVQGGGSAATGNMSFTVPGTTEISQSWYLVSEGSISPSPVVRSEIPVSMSVPSLAQQFSLTMLDTLDDRVGSELLDPNGTAHTGAWTRVIGQTGNHGSHNPVSNFTSNGPAYDWNFSGIQLGYDIYRKTHQNQSNDVVGVDIGFGQLNSSIENSLYTGKAGDVQLQGYAFGAYWTHYANNGWYADAVFQGTDYNKLRLNSVEGEVLGSHGAGYLGSLETGWRFNYIHNVSVTPEAQLIYQQINISSAADSFSIYRFSRVNATFGRIGAKISKNWNFMDKFSQLTSWGRVNIWHDFNPQSHITVLTLSAQNPVDMGSRFAQNWAEFSLGTSGQLKNGVTLFTSGNYATLFSGIEGNIWSGQIGIKYVR